jgi:hypothetical protein
MNRCQYRHRFDVTHAAGGISHSEVAIEGFNARRHVAAFSTEWTVDVKHAADPRIKPTVAALLHA